MAGKIVDINPAKRLSKEAFEEILTSINSLQFDETKSIVFIAQSEEGHVSVHSYGLDFHTYGMSQAILTTLGQHLLAEDAEDVTELEDL